MVVAADRREAEVVAAEEEAARRSKRLRLCQRSRESSLAKNDDLHLQELKNQLHWINDSYRREPTLHFRWDR